jgi:hypothetical protein
MRPEQAEIERLRREVQKLKAERDILKNRRLLREGPDMVRCEAPGGLGGVCSLRGARCLAQRVLCVAEAGPECPLAS